MRWRTCLLLPDHGADSKGFSFYLVPGKHRSVYVDLSLQCHTKDWDHSSLNEGMDTVSGIPSDTVPITEGMQNLPLDVKAISRQSVKWQSVPQAKLHPFIRDAKEGTFTKAQTPQHITPRYSTSHRIAKRSPSTNTTHSSVKSGIRRVWGRKGPCH